MKSRMIDFYTKIAETNKFPSALFFCLILLMVFNVILSLPITQRISEIMFSSMNVPEEQMNMMMGIMQKMKYVSIVSALFTGAVYIFVVSLILYLLCKLFRAKITYWGAMTVFLVGALFHTLNDIINTGITLFKGLEQISSPYDVYHTGLNVLTSVEQIGVAGYILLSNITVLGVLFVIIIAIGLKFVCNISKFKASIIAIILWLLLASFTVASVSLSSMASNLPR